jgi:hypothetical protein
LRADKDQVLHFAAPTAGERYGSPANGAYWEYRNHMSFISEDNPEFQGTSMGSAYFLKLFGREVMKLLQNGLKHCIQVRMIPGELIAMLENKLIAGADNKNAALLPGITVCETLSETFPHRLYTADQR